MEKNKLENKRIKIYGLGGKHLKQGKEYNPGGPCAKVLIERGLAAYEQEEKPKRKRRKKVDE